MKNIENKIYALKDGDHPGIYMSWLDFYPEAEKLELFYSKSFEYQESLIEEPATVLGSLRWAILHAKEYLGDANAQIYGEYPCSADFYETTAQKNINLNTLENLIVPYCNIDEQRFIVAEINARLSLCDHIEQTVDTALSQAEAMRRSILKKAFEGGLN